MANPSEQEVIERVGRRIGEVRAAAGITQEALATALGIATKNLQRLEGGRQNLTLASIARVARELGVDARDLLALSGTRRLERSRSSRAWAVGLEAVGVTPTVSPSPNAVPITTLHAVAAALAAQEPVDVAARAWAPLPDRKGKPESGSFIARVQGSAMEPRIGDGAWCVFRAPASTKGVGEAALVAVHHDESNTPSCLVRIVERPRGRKGPVRLVPLANDVPVLEVDGRNVDILADFVRVLPPS
jgi:transcriptional regulator with XRE-family HTH domain